MRIRELAPEGRVSLACRDPESKVTLLEVHKGREWILTGIKALTELRKLR